MKPFNTLTKMHKTEKYIRLRKLLMQKSELKKYLNKKLFTCKYEYCNYTNAATLYYLGRITLIGLIQRKLLYVKQSKIL